MEINNTNVSAVETLARPEAVDREPTPRPANPEPPEPRTERQAFQVQLSAEARARREADQAALERLSQQQQLSSTYNASGEIGG